jgi:hypothetical protein
MRPGDLVRVCVAFKSKRCWLYRYDVSYSRLRLSSIIVEDGDIGVVLKTSPKDAGYFLLDAPAYDDYVQVLVSGRVGWLSPEWLKVVS